MKNLGRNYISHGFVEYYQWLMVNIFLLTIKRKDLTLIIFIIDIFYYV